MSGELTDLFVMTSENSNIAARTPVARAATPTDADAMGAMFARAFADDPVWAWLCAARIARFTHWATPFFATETRRHVRLGSAWTTPGDDSGALWAPPGKWQTSLGDLARWAPSAVRVFGLRLGVSLQALSAVDKVHPTEPHWYLALLGTDPERQGHGLGSAVLTPVLDRCDAEGLPAYLESSKERNVSFYERHGFTVTEQMHLGRNESGPPMWLMWREPRPPGGH